MPDQRSGGPSGGGSSPGTGLTRFDRIAAITETEFLALPVARRLEVLPYLQPTKRRNFILACEDARELVEAMQVQDLFLTVKEIGLDDAAGIVSLMNVEQFRSCLDFDVWTRDEVNDDGAWRWLTVLAEAGVEALIQKVSQLDFELDIALFAAHIRVFIAKEDFDPDEGTPPGSVTADGVHYLVIEGDDDLRDLIRTTFIDLFHRDHDFYLRLLSAVRDGTSTQVTEEAFRWRTARLADLGFPDYVEALKVYARPEKRKDRPGPRAGVPAGEVPPSFALLSHNGAPTVPLDLLVNLDSDGAAAVAAGAAHLVNWLTVADRIDPGETEQVRAVMEKARGYVSIGLSEFGEDPAKVLVSAPMIDIFRAGYAKALDLAERAKKIVAEHPLVAGDKKAMRLDETARETVAALLQQRPLLYLGALKPSATGTGPFSSPQEIAIVGGILDRIDASAEIFGSVLKIFKRDLGSVDLKGCNVASRDDLTASRLFNTALAQKLLKGSFKLAPVPAAELKRLHDLLFTGIGAQIDLSPALADEATEIAALVGDRRPDLRRPAMQFVNACIEDLKEGFGHVDFTQPLKPAFISALLIR